MKRALQKPEESVRKPQIIDDSVLLSATDNAQRQTIAEIDSVTLADTISAIASQIRQTLFGTSVANWTDLPPASIKEIVELLYQSGMSIWTAGEDISHGQALYPSPSEDTVFVARSVALSHTGVIGVAMGAASSGGQVLVAHTGKLVSGFTDLVVGSRYFLQSDGSLGPMNPTSGGSFTLRCGYAKNKTTLLVSIGEPRVRP